MKKKNVPYYGNGAGRETYILYNGGGYFSSKNILFNQEQSLRTRTSLDNKITKNYKSPFYKKAPIIHYFGTGKGRETYVLSNGGGLCTSEKSLNSYKLTDFLRTKDGSISRNYGRNGKLGLSKSEFKYQEYLQKKENELIKRLYDKDKIKFTRLKPILTEENTKIYPNDDNIKERLQKVIYNQTETCNKETFNFINNINKGYKGIQTKLFKNPKLSKKLKCSVIKRHTKNLTEDKLRISIDKINSYESKNIQKKFNKPIIQPYLHLRNISLSSLLK